MKNILVVDDDPDMLDLLSTTLNAADYSVITAANGLEALKRAQSLPDLIVLDLVLPEIDGFTVCQTLKEGRTTAHIPIMLLTGLTSQLSRFAGLECGANDYVTKPFQPEELVSRVNVMLGRSAGTPTAPQPRARALGQRSSKQPPKTTVVDGLVANRVTTGGVQSARCNIREEAICNVILRHSVD